MLPITRRAVLVIEDDLDLREWYSTTLKLAGFAVVAVEDGIDALRHIDGGHRPDAVVLDLALPRLHGRDFQNEIAAHAETANIPIVVVSGTDTRTLNPKHFACVLRKPVDADQLVDAVNRCLARTTK